MGTGESYPAVVRTLTFRHKADQTLELWMLPPDTWSEHDAEQLLAAIYAAPKPHALSALPN